MPSPGIRTIVCFAISNESYSKAGHASACRTNSRHAEACPTRPLHVQKRKFEIAIGILRLNCIMEAVISDRRSCHVNACRFIDCSLRADHTGNTTGLDLPDADQDEKPPASSADAGSYERGRAR